jgi:hypothetical protein
MLSAPAAAAKKKERKKKSGRFSNSHYDHWRGTKPERQHATLSTPITVTVKE